MEKEKNKDQSYILVAKTVIQNRRHKVSIILRLQRRCSRKIQCVIQKGVTMC